MQYGTFLPRHSPSLPAPEAPAELRGPWRRRTGLGRLRTVLPTIGDVPRLSVERLGQKTGREGDSQGTGCVCQMPN